jgi:hypothetical protein
LFTGILEGMGSPEAVAGDIIIDATESVRVIELALVIILKNPKNHL